MSFAVGNQWAQIFEASTSETTLSIRSFEN